MDVITIEAKPREAGRSAARAARREGLVPCILYGHHVEPVTFKVPELSLRPLIYTTETHRIAIKIDGSSFDCIMKDVDLHPVTDVPIHADFQVLRADEKITLKVPVHLIGTPVGQIQQGGETAVVLHELTVSCLPGDIPAAIDIEIEHLSIGDSIHVSDVSVPGITIHESPDATIVTVAAPRVEVVEEAEVDLEGTETVDTAEADSDEEL
ncbi:MAG TPA: 50S ribosomal protein L25 [Rhodothermales bacterium]|nr:50S ribosomal protein L25 [Rhodothermales bacterium]